MNSALPDVRVEMGLARTRALTRNGGCGSNLLVIRRNGISPYEGIDTQAQPPPSSLPHIVEMG